MEDHCHHELCVCPTPAGGYCSDWCRENAASGTDACHCGHEECGARA